MTNYLASGRGIPVQVKLAPRQRTRRDVPAAFVILWETGKSATPTQRKTSRCAGSCLILLMYFVFLPDVNVTAETDERKSSREVMKGMMKMSK